MQEVKNVEEDIDDDDEEDDDEDDDDTPRSKSATEQHRKQRSSAFTSPNKPKAQQQRFLSRNHRATSASSSSTIDDDVGTLNHMTVMNSGATHNVEELTLQARQEVQLIVRLCPLMDTEVDHGGNEGNLKKCNFKVFFTSKQHIDHWNNALADSKALDDFASALNDHDDGLDIFDQSGTPPSAQAVLPWQYSVTCRARVATSIINVEPPVVHLGDCNIGEYKSFSITLSNVSDLPALVAPQVTSKVVSCSDEEIRIQPKSSAVLKVEYLPRKINSDYRKTVTIFNRLNDSNTQKVEIRASNVDTHHVLYHAAFYGPVVPTSLIKN